MSKYSQYALAKKQLLLLVENKLLEDRWQFQVRWLYSLLSSLEEYAEEECLVPETDEEKKLAQEIEKLQDFYS